MKVLSPAPLEILQQVYVDNPRLRNCRFPVKVMFMGVVGKPTNTCNGRLFLEHVSTAKESERVSHHESFSDHFLTNHLIKSGEWNALFNQDFVGSMDTKDLFTVIGELCVLESDVIDNLCLLYSSHTCAGKTVKMEDAKKVLCWITESM